MPAVVVEQLRKSYGGRPVVDGVTFDVEEGEVFALLGPNGAGKTTTVEILEGHRRADDGSVTVLSFDPRSSPRDLRERIGIVLQEAGFDEDFTVAELLQLQRGFYPRRLEIDALIAQVGLEEKRNARVTTLSGGQRRRLDLALGLVGDPEMPFLDELTTGFDPSARRQRRRSTPLPAGLYLVGRTEAGLGLTLVILAAILVVGFAAFGLRVAPGGLVLGIAVLLPGGLALADCGFLLTTLVPSARAVGAVGLVILFLLAFFSDVFINQGPGWARSARSSR